MANYFLVNVFFIGIQSIVYGADEILPSSGGGHFWAVEVKHDPAGGRYRVSGDGPKLKIPADPTTDIGDGPGSFLTAEQIQSHPNYPYLTPLSECGLHQSSLLFLQEENREWKEDGEDEQHFEDITGRGNVGDSEEMRVKRIVGGSAARRKKYPWVVQLYLVQSSTGEHTFHCAGTIISNTTILTAAHCLTRIQSGYSLDVIVVGTNDRRDVKFCKTANLTENCTRELIKGIDDVEIHQSYCEGNLHHDIGLIYLKRELKFSEHVQPICLPQSERILEFWPNLKLLAAGWGSTSKYTEGFNSAVLKEVEVDLQPRSLCDKFHVRVYGKTGIERICTGGNAERATCNGDSGGGLMKSLSTPNSEANGSSSNNIMRMFQFGIVSAGGHVTDTCGFQGRPTLETNVMFYIDWILNHIKPGVNAYRMAPTSATWLTTNKTGGESEEPSSSSSPQYKNEFSTGKQVDVSMHPNVKTLPPFEQCGNSINPSFVPSEKEEINDFGDVSDEEEVEEEDNNNRRDSGGGSGGERKKRIVGGSPTTLQNFLPWLAQLYSRNVENNQLTLRCSGTIITKRHILTAAHCVTELTTPFVLERVVVGQYNRNSTSECLDGQCFFPQVLKFAEVVIHPEYEKFTHRNNLAIIRLAEEIEFNKMVQPICLPRRESLMDGLRVHQFFSAGWGRVTRDTAFSKPNDKFSVLLLQAHVTLHHRKECDFLYSRSIDLLGRARLCGGGKPAIGECTADGGSPLMKRMETGRDHPLNNKVFQMGLVAFTDCGMEGMPTVYLNIIYYMEWVLDNLGESDF